MQSQQRQERHQLVIRQPKFDLADSPVHWLPKDEFASHMVNGINLLLPAGELWFCRVYNKALPMVTDPQLRKDVEGFIRQEANHARAHRQAEKWLADNGYDIEPVLDRANWLFGQVLGEDALGYPLLTRAIGTKRWLVLRVGIIAAIEHFTGMLGDWCMNSDGWDIGDPVVADLFRWHLAEEVEHRSVAFELFEHLCKTELGFYVSRQALMAVVFPMFIYLLSDAARDLAGQDPDPKARKIARMSIVRMVFEMERNGRSRDTLPKFSMLVRRTLRWAAPSFHPEPEGDTEQALAYIARSPSAQAGTIH
ncbi:metal-dependent hydrolase [Isoalcanivorax beigongshangi]|uniref:Metal-dependent hydrolase n=1 Tax=Isoalcanivorax beigongshangi TaxID=3238810 RepID=A0ABV4AGD9_9GAMM